MESILVYVHIGETLPRYFYDNLYQVYLQNYHTNCQIFLIVDHNLHDEIRQEIQEMKCFWFLKSYFHLVSLQSISRSFPLDDRLFANDFFQYAYDRLDYVYGWMKQYGYREVFHIETDVMLYTPVPELKSLVQEMGLHHQLVAVQDARSRALASILYVPSVKVFEGFFEFCQTFTQAMDGPIHEMLLLGSYPGLETFPNTLTDKNIKYGYWDGAALGQYLGGVDPRNITGYTGSPYKNPTIGFINETSDFKPNTASLHLIQEKRMSGPSFNKIFLNKQIPVHSLHIHSKDLTRFSSLSTTIPYEEIISGHRIFSKCDFIVCKKSNQHYDQGLKHLQIPIFVVDDMEQIITQSDIEKFKTLDRPLRVGLYTHTMDCFVFFLINQFPDEFRYHIYLHNTDNIWYGNHYVLEDCRIQRIYAQNPMSLDDKTFLLPIGIANPMFPHGDMDTLYRVYSETYYKEKSKNLYINLNTITYQYRSKAYKIFAKERFGTIQAPLPYEEYLRELAKHRFCLCIRGNGIDTHRFWECLYLGVVPVIVNNKHTRMDKFVQHLRKNNLPFYEINTLQRFCSTHDELFFNQERYDQYFNNWEQVTPHLLLSHYFQK